MTDPWKQRWAAYGLIPAPTPMTLAASDSTPAVGPHSADDRDRAYALGALASASSQLAGTGTARNDALKTHAWALIGFVNTGALTETEYIDGLTDAGRACSGLGDHPFTDTEIAATLRHSLDKGRALGLTRYAPPDVTVTEVAPGTLGPTNGHPSNPGAKPEPGRVVSWRRGSEIATAVPHWAWCHGGRGRIQRGTLALLAGRPGAGKSTAARWFAAQATLGKLEGCWEGKPQHVAYIAAEESVTYTVGPGLAAAGADMSHIHLPKVTRDGEPTALLGTLDEAALLAYLQEHRISVVIIDPLMSTVTVNADLNRNNEIRAQVAPWARIAEAVHGVTLGIVHLRKNASGDVVAAITGSSAFGEIARSIFGFAKNIENDTRVMSQHKNSVGHEDLSVTYEITSVPVELTDGDIADIGTFRITGESEITVEDILSDSALHTGGAALECQRWLADYLSVEGPIRSKDVKAAALKEGGWAHATVERAARKLRTTVEWRDFPCVTYWSLPVTSSDLKVDEPLSPHSGLTNRSEATGGDWR